MIITPLGPGYIPQVIQINAASKAGSWKSEHFYNEILYPHSISLGFLETNKLTLVGFIFARLITFKNSNSIKNEVDLLLTATHTDFLRQGIAGTLLKYLMGMFAGNNIEIQIEVRESNRTAANFYNKYNFRKIYTRKNYYTTPSENAVVMQYSD